MLTSTTESRSGELTSKQKWRQVRTCTWTRDSAGPGWRCAAKRGGRRDMAERRRESKCAAVVRERNIASFSLLCLRAPGIAAVVVPSLLLVHRRVEEDEAPSSHTDAEGNRGAEGAGGEQTAGANQHVPVRRHGLRVQEVSAGSDWRWGGGRSDSGCGCDAVEAGLIIGWLAMQRRSMQPCCDASGSPPSTHCAVCDSVARSQNAAACWLGSRDSASEALPQLQARRDVPREAQEGREGQEA